VAVVDRAAQAGRRAVRVAVKVAVARVGAASGVVEVDRVVPEVDRVGPAAGRVVAAVGSAVAAARAGPEAAVSGRAGACCAGEHGGTAERPAPFSVPDVVWITACSVRTG
jgi:hypothetical protein